MTPAQARELIGLYFGPLAAEQFDPLWPETMLGLSPAMTDRATIEGALQHRLALVRAHPTSGGPLARQLTHALQSVADQMVRLYTPDGQEAETPPAPGRPVERPVDMLGSGSAPPPLPTGAKPKAAKPARPPSPSRPRPKRELTGLEADASRLLMQHGRVDFALVQQLSAIAQSKGLPASAVGTTIANLASSSPIEVPDDEEQRAGSPPARGASEEPVGHGYGPISDGAGQEAGEAFVRKAVIIGSVGVAVVVVTLIVLLISASGGGGGGGAKGGGATPGGGAGTNTGVNSGGRTDGTGQKSAAATTPPADEIAAQPTTQPGDGQPAASTMPKTLKPTTANPTPAEASAPDAAGVLNDLRKASELARDLPAEADMKFVGAVRSFKAWWPKYDASYRQAMLDATTEYLLRVADDAPRMSSALGEVLPTSPMIDPDAKLPGLTAADVWPEIWSCGMLVRLSRERNLPAEATRRVQDALELALGADRPSGTPTFNSGVVLGVRLTPARLLPSLRSAAANDADPAVRDPAIADIVLAFQRWEEAAKAAASVALDPAAAERGAAELVLDGIEQVLRGAPDPLTNQASFQLVTSLIGRERFKPGEVSRTRLLSWLADGRIGSPMLNVATAAVASRSMAEGVDLTMILPARATEAQRAQLRERFAAAWSITPAGGTAGDQSAWAMKVREVLAESKRDRTGIEELAQAAALARLNLAASLRWSNKPEEAAAVLGKSTTGSALLFVMSSGGVNISVARAAEEQPRWALQLLVADRTIAAKVTRLKDMESSGGDSLSQMDADVVVELACTHGVAELRKAAQAAALKYSNSPVTLYALLKVLPRVPRNAAVGDFIEKLTGAPLGPMSRDDWMLNARRATVDRMLELMAGSSPSSAMDTLAAGMAETYAELTGDASLDAGAPSPAKLRMQAERQYRKLRAEAERFVPNERAPVRLDAVDARREARRSLASGPVQMFAVEQLAAVEAMAYVVTGEKPATAPMVRALLAELTAQRRASNDILTQVRLAEETMARLWALRLGEEMP